jgi:hypothetical protein
MTDLRELLREARGWLACVEPINEPVVNALKAKIDAALAQQPEPVILMYRCPACGTEMQVDPASRPRYEPIPAQPPEHALAQIKEAKPFATLYEMRAREGGGGQWLTLNPLDPNGVAQRAIPVYDAPKPPAGKGEAAWMIECKEDFTGWWDGALRNGMIDCRFFSKDPNDCIRFARKEDAERAIARGGHSCQIATEHMWPFAGGKP